MDQDNGTPAVRSTASLVDADDLRCEIAAAFTATPIDEVRLRRGVWTYVGAERHAGTSPGHVIMALTELVEASEIFPPTVRQAFMRHVILWCVEAYFGHLGGDVVGRSGTAFSDSPTPLPIR
ncbi:MAG TPA: hypothetical protein VFT29_19110 [Gemmatimonadaceae bacterium]|nr:hypothetical protein [Gemmatimonadaceae bacterium]